MIRIRGTVELLFSDGVARGWGFQHKEGEFMTAFVATEPATVTGVMYRGHEEYLRQQFVSPKQLSPGDTLNVQLPMTCHACDGTGKFEVFARRRLAGETL